MTNHTPSPETDWIDTLLDAVQNYTIQSALGGTPFKTQEENQTDNDKAYEAGRTEAKAIITARIEAAVSEALASIPVTYTGNSLGKMNCPHCAKPLQHGNCPDRCYEPKSGKGG